MKYIRTKDGRIVDIEDWSYFKNYYFIAKNDIIISKHFIFKVDKIYIDEVDIIKQADTIEELCDEFVVMRKHFKTLKNAKKYFKKKENEIIGITLRGAIWTEKGLIYVAKMNNEGKLVCLE